MTVLALKCTRAREAAMTERAARRGLIGHQAGPAASAYAPSQVEQL